MRKNRRTLIRCVYRDNAGILWGSDAEERKMLVWLQISTIFGLCFHVLSLLQQGNYYHCLVRLPSHNDGFFIRGPLDFALWFCVTMGYSARCLHTTSLRLHISFRYNGFKEEGYAFRQWVQADLLNVGLSGFAMPYYHHLQNFCIMSPKLQLLNRL